MFLIMQRSSNSEGDCKDYGSQTAREYCKSELSTESRAKGVYACVFACVKESKRERFVERDRERVCCLNYQFNIAR